MPRRIAILATTVDEGPKSMPLGALCAARAIAAASPLGAGVELPRRGESAADFARRVASAGGLAAAGFSVYCWNRAYMAEAARALRGILPDAFLFAGGPEATACPESLLAEAPWELAVAGEAEAAAGAIALRAGGGPRPPGPGLFWKGEGAPAVPRAVHDFAAEDSSVWTDGSAAAFGGWGALWELARGCPYRCSYCYESRGAGRPRLKDPALARRELGAIRDSGRAQAYVLDPTFNADKARAAALLAMMAEVAPGLHYEFEMRAELIDGRMAAALARLDCSVQIGLQSSDPAISAAAGRPLDRGLFRRGVAALDARGVRFGLDLIYGLPGDTLAKFRESLDFALGLGPNHLDAFRLAVLPGTALADGAEAAGLRWRRAAPYLLEDAPGFPAADLDAAERLARACDAFYERGRAVAWFMPLCRALRLPPSALLARAADALDSAGPAARGEAPDPGARAIEELQLALAERELAARGKGNLVPAALDLIRHNAAWVRAALEGIEGRAPLRYPAELLESPLALDIAALASSARPGSPMMHEFRRERDGSVRVRRL